MILGKKIVWRRLSCLESNTFFNSKYLCKSVKFNNNIVINSGIISKFLSFYEDVFRKLINNHTSKATVSSIILSEFIWCNSNKVDNKLVHCFFDRNVNFIGQLFDTDGNIKLWDNVKTEFHLKDLHRVTGRALFWMTKTMQI